MRVRWAAVDVDYIRTRSDRYPGAVDIEVAWADEASEDPNAVIVDRDPRSHRGAMRITGFSASAGFVITVVADRIGDEVWGNNAWKASGGDRRAYREAVQGG